MQVESHATPFGGTPQQRYASLHRAIEQGLESDDVWVELTAVCQTLGHRGEALNCVQRIRDVARRARSERGLLDPDERRARDQDHTKAPAAASPGADARPARVDRSDELPGVGEHLVDACQYMLHQHMPLLVLTTTLAFPLVVGVGGFLTAGGSLLLLAAIAALPGLSVLAVVAAMGRRILLRSSDGDGDVPELPALGPLLRDARAFALDAALVTALFVTPPAALLAAGAPLYATLPSVAMSALLAPLAFALLQVRGDLRALSPTLLLRALRRAGRGYPVVAAAATLAFAPAMIAAFAALDRPVWVQIAVVGPLVVLPVFATCRLLGSWLDTYRAALGHLARPSQAQASPAQPSQAVQQRPSAEPPQRRRAAPPRARRREPAAAAPRAIEGRGPQRAAVRSRVNKATAPAARPTPAAATTCAAETPDLTSIPGAVVVRGEARARSGAAARRG